MEISCLLVDDEPPSVSEIKNILSMMDHVEVIGVASIAEPDLVFLDIKKPGRNGFDIVKACSDMTDRPFFVFATA